MCGPFNRILKAMRYFFFPASKHIDDRTTQIDQSIANLKVQKALVAEMTNKVNQPDMLRSLVISMSETGRRNNG